MHSKRIPKFSKTLPGIFTIPFKIGLEILELLVEWKAPRVHYREPVYRANWLDVKMIFPAWFDHLEEKFSFKEVQSKHFLPAYENQLLKFMFT